jgi:hypothetical protein
MGHIILGHTEMQQEQSDTPKCWTREDMQWMQQKQSIKQKFWILRRGEYIDARGCHQCLGLASGKAMLGLTWILLVRLLVKTA